MQPSTKLALTIRVLIALATSTFFQPDEYFQALEPAHHLVFGYGHLTWEWLSPHPIRSFIYPALNVPIFWLLRVTHLADSARLGDWLLASVLFYKYLFMFSTSSDPGSQDFTWSFGGWHRYMALQTHPHCAGCRCCSSCGALLCHPAFQIA
jgi:hypothetical protein